MPIGMIVLVLSIGFAVHVVRTGRPLFWLWPILFLPAVGCAVYFFAELLPELTGSRPVRRAVAQAGGILTAKRDFQELAAAVADAPTVANRCALAEALLQRGDTENALTHYRDALSPPHQDDPLPLLGLARCYFAHGEPAAALEALDHLLATNPGYQSHEGHLLYARALEATGRTEEALAEYAALAPVFPGQEARLRYGLLLRNVGRSEEAKVQFAGVIHACERGTRHSRRLNREWFDLAKRYVGE